MKRNQLKPGDIVKNLVSQKYGYVLPHPKHPRRLHRAHEDYVRVRVHRVTHGELSRLDERCWLVAHLEDSNRPKYFARELRKLLAPKNS